MRGSLKRFMAGAPAPLVDMAKAAYGLVPDWLKYGREYRDALSLLMETEKWDEGALAALQETLLRRLIRHSFTSVPYYRELFTRAGILPSDIKTVSDLQNLPCLTKEIVRKNKKSLLSAQASTWKTEPELTSGSTGQPLDFTIDSRTRAIERALVMRHLLWLGYRKGDVVAELQSDRFADPRRVYRYFPLSKLLRFDSFRLDERKLASIVATLRKFRPAYIRSYPSTLYVLCRWLLRNRQSIHPPEYIITSSEKLYPFIRELAETTLGCPVVDHYGQNEQVAYAFQCSERKGYHVQTEQNIVELLPSGTGQWEIVGTSLQNLAMPFIRYRTADYAVPGNEPCPCGRRHPIIAEIGGKHGDLIVTPERSLISLVAMTYPFDHIESIREAQIIQEDLNTLRVKIVAWEGLTEETRTLLLRKLRGFVRSDRMNFLIEEVTEIPGTGAGKKPFIISRLKIDDYL